MTINVACPQCGKKLNAKDELAGRRAKCPKCGNAILVPSISPGPEVRIDLYDRFVEAVENSDAEEVAAYFRTHDVTLIESVEHSDDDHKGALHAEIDDIPVIVAFTSEEFAREFANVMPDMLDAEGKLPAFVISGVEFLKGLPDDFGVLLNAECDDGMVLEPDLMAEVKQVLFNPSHTAKQNDEGTDYSGAKQLRQEVMEFLHVRGFQPADWLPLCNMDRQVRPAAEIASRLMSLAAVFTWGSAPDEAVPTESIKDFIKKNRLRNSLTEEDVKILKTPRSQARDEYAGSVGWKLENMWPLAWILGFESEPTIAASQIENEVTEAIMFGLLEGLNRGIDDLLQNAKLRSAAEVLALEDRFYCAHNAVRSAQLGQETVPADFHPIVHGGAVHERRHSLTWSLSPGTSWDETDLST